MRLTWWTAPGSPVLSCDTGGLYNSVSTVSTSTAPLNMAASLAGPTRVPYNSRGSFILHTTSGNLAGPPHNSGKPPFSPTLATPPVPSQPTAAQIVQDGRHQDPGPGPGPRQRCDLSRRGGVGGPATHQTGDPTAWVATIIRRLYLTDLYLWHSAPANWQEWPARDAGSVPPRTQKTDIIRLLRLG